MVDRLDVVAVGDEPVGAVVAFVVLGPKPRRAVVAPSCLQRRGVGRSTASRLGAEKATWNPATGRSLA